MNTFFPSTGSQADWNAAFYRLEDYFRALRMVNKVHQSQIILQVLEKAAQRHASDPDLSPIVLAMEEAHASMDRWFQEILGPRERLSVVGLISLQAVDAPSRWPVAFLSDQIPPEFRSEMRESDVRAGPDLQVSSMVPRPIEVGPLLDPFHFSHAFDKVKGTLAIFAMMVVVALSVSLFFSMR